MHAPSVPAEPGAVPARFAPGQILDGKFQVERVLGHGGMGVVLAAHHLQLGRTVALKLMLLTAARRDGAHRERFLREARTSVRLKSEHVSRVIDTGTLEDDAPYIVMEYLEGQDLDELRRAQGRLDVVQAVDFVLQAGEAVAEAHAHGIVHRDLKPANLFVTARSDGSTCVKVLDFGLAKDVAGPLAPLTDPSTTVGSPRYMAPEQLRAAGELDARADVWAMGVILYELVAGRPPFTAGGLVDLAVRILTAAPAPLDVEVPPGFEAVVRRCLEKHPAARYPSIAALAAALAPFGPPHAGAVATRIARIGAGARATAEPLLVASGARRSTSVNALASTAPSAPSALIAGATRVARRGRRGRVGALLGAALLAMLVVTAMLLGLR